MRESRGGVFQGRFHNLLISKNNTFWAPQISRITFQVVSSQPPRLSHATWCCLSGRTQIRGASQARMLDSGCPRAVDGDTESDANVGGPPGGGPPTPCPAPAIARYPI